MWCEFLFRYRVGSSWLICAVLTGDHHLLWFEILARVCFCLVSETASLFWGRFQGTTVKAVSPQTLWMIWVVFRLVSPYYNVWMHSVPETWTSSAKGTTETPLFTPIAPNLVSWNDCISKVAAHISWPCNWFTDVCCSFKAVSMLLLLLILSCWVSLRLLKLCQSFSFREGDCG